MDAVIVVFTIFNSSVDDDDEIETTTLFGTKDGGRGRIGGSAVGRDVTHHHRRRSEPEYDGGEKGVGVDVTPAGDIIIFF